MGTYSQCNWRGAISCIWFANVCLGQSAATEGQTGEGTLSLLEDVRRISGENGSIRLESCHTHQLVENFLPLHLPFSSTEEKQKQGTVFISDVTWMNKKTMGTVGMLHFVLYRITSTRWSSVSVADFCVCDKSLYLVQNSAALTLGYCRIIHSHSFSLVISLLLLFNQDKNIPQTVGRILTCWCLPHPPRSKVSPVQWNTIC